MTESKICDGKENVCDGKDMILVYNNNYQPRICII